MKSIWTLDSIDLNRSMMKVHKHESAVTKTFFVTDLIEAKLNLNTLVAICKDCVWVIDVDSGVRRTMSEKLMNSTNSLSDLVNLQSDNLPEFLKKTT